MPKDKFGGEALGGNKYVAGIRNDAFAHLGKMSKHMTPEKPSVKKVTQTIMGNIRKRNQALKNVEY